MPKRPFLVLPAGECVPLEGPYRIELHRGTWYVLGRHEVIPCESEAEASIALQRVMMEHDAHALAEEALVHEAVVELQAGAHARVPLT